MADQKDDRDSHKECSDDTLNHDEDGFAAAVKITDKTKQYGGQQTVDGVCFQVLVRGVNDQRFARKKGRQPVARKNAAHPITAPAKNAV